MKKNETRKVTTENFMSKKQTRRQFLSRTGKLGLGMAAASMPLKLGKAYGTTKYTLRMMHTEAEPLSREAFDSIIADFNKKHPNVEIRYEAMNVADIFNRLLAMLAAGAPPDLTHVPGQSTVSFQANGLLEPLDDIVNSIGPDDIYERPRDLGSKVDGHWYGVVHGWGSVVYLYRQDWADKAGLKEPTSWAEQYDWLQELNRPAEQVYALDMVGASGYMMDIDIGMFMGSNGGNLWTEHGLPNFQNEHMYGVVEHFRKLTEFMAPGWLTHNYIDTLANIASGKVACISSWGRTMGYIEKYSPDIADPEHFGVMEWRPVGPLAGGPPSKKMNTELDGEHWVIFNATKHKELAKEFLMHFYRPEQYIKWCDSVPLHILPITKSMYTSDSYRNHPKRKKWKRWLDTQEKYMAAGLAWPNIMTQESDGKIKWLLEINNSGIMADMIYDVIDKKKDVKWAVKKAEKRINDLIATVAGFKK